MARVARLPSRSAWTREYPDRWLAMGLLVTLVLATAGSTVWLLGQVAGLDSEVGQVYPLQRRVRVLEDDLRAHRWRQNDFHTEEKK